MKDIPIGKLVRDKMPQVIGEDGYQCCVSSIEPYHMETALTHKLMEEAVEFASSLQTAELVDVLEVVRTIAGLRGFTLADMELAADSKKEKRGGFSMGVFLISVRGAA